VFFLLFHHVKDQFDPTRNSEFVIDAEQIVAYRVFSETEFQGNFPIRHAFRDKIRDLKLARGE